MLTPARTLSKAALGAVSTFMLSVACGASSRPAPPSRPEPATDVGMAPDPSPAADDRTPRPGPSADVDGTPDLAPAPQPAAVDDVAPRVDAVIAQVLHVELARVTDRASLIDDLGADDLALVELAVTLEGEFRIDIAADDFAKLVTVGDVVAYVRGHR